MQQSFFERLVKYYSNVGMVLRGQAEVASIFPNPSDKGLTREQVYLKFLENHLPLACRAMLGGFLFGLDGSESRQLDVIVTSSTAPRYQVMDKAFACVEGTLAVASV